MREGFSTIGTTSAWTTKENWHRQTIYMCVCLSLGGFVYGSVCLGPAYGLCQQMTSQRPSGCSD
jgi:hypothetical protein